MKKILKRDGRIERFYKEKITWAIFKAAQACGGDDFKKSEELADQVVEVASFRY
ncbi:MAG TPA: ATP cone domain-containing protein, partial [Clostridia bacterium]|nr:ATP cone domain-containing protein [Clostridia bacterium]